MRCLQWIVWLCMSLWLGKVQAQVDYRLLTVADGLPCKEVYEVFCDSKGYLWFGHALGISRFDGNRFAHYQYAQQNGLGISCIREDAQGNIWCRNFGAQIFVIRHNKMQLLDAYDWQKQLSFPSINITKDNCLVAAHKDGLFVYDIAKGRSTICMIGNQPAALADYGVCVLNGKAIVANNGKLYGLSNSNTILPLPVQLKQGHALADFNIFSGCFKDSVYIQKSSRDSVMACYMQTGVLIEARCFAIPKGFYNVSAISDHEAWVCSKTISYSLQQKDQYIHNTSVTSVAKDREGQLWFTSLQDGIGRVQQHTSTLAALPFQLGNTDIIKSIASFKQSIAISTNLGYLYFLEQGLKHYRVLKEPNNIHIDALYNYKDSMLYAGSTFLLQANLDKLDTIRQASSVKDIAADDRGNLYVANSFSLLKIQTNKVKTVMRPKRCIAVECVNNQTVYAVFSDGVFKFEQEKAEEILFEGKPIYAVNIAAFKDTLAVATIANGVVLFVQGKPIAHLTEQNGLLSNRVTKIKWLHGAIWMLTPKSIDCYTSKQQVLHYTAGNTIEFGAITDFTWLQGKLYLCGGTDLHIIDLKKYPSSRPPLVVIDALLVNQQDSIANKTNTFAYYENNIQFILSGLSTSSGKQISFAYRLLGADTNWHQTDATHFIIDFPALKPGNYTFEAMALSADGAQSNIVKYAFEIKKPWWLQWWFWSGLVLVATLATIWLVKIRISNIQLKNKLLLEKLHLQSDLRDSMLTAIKSQMNPHFIFNALNTIQSYIYTNDENKASNYLGKFSDLIRLILDTSQRKTIPLAKEIEMLQLYIDLEVMRFENNMQASIVVDTTVNTEAIQIPPMLVQPYVENAVKHGLLHKANDRQLKVSFTLDEQKKFLHIEIDDNGVGRKASDEINQQRRKSYASFSTFANQHRFDLLNQTLEQKITITYIDKYNAAQMPSGTTVLLKIPL